jgi:S1-C subfamily serine protease
MEPMVDEPPRVLPAPAPLPSAPPPQPRIRRGFWLAAAACGIAVVSGGLGALVAVELHDRATRPPQRASTLGVEVAEPRAEPLPAMDVAAVADSVGASVVAIQNPVAADDGTVLGESLGTGVVVTADGEIITNEHVVRGADEVNVRLVGETEPRRAAVIAADADVDLALLRVDVEGLSPVTLAAPGDVRVGDQVLAIGYALDLDGDPTVTSGIVSALDRALDTNDGVLGGLIQTDAAISSGNSGGPLVNARGELVGINTLVAADRAGASANGLGFAVSNEDVAAAIERLRAQAGGEPAPSGFLGVELASRTDGGSGALVRSIVPDSPAEQIGLREGDAVIAVDGRAISGQAGLVAVIRAREPGDEVTVEAVRNGEEMTFTATLAERPEE